MPRSTRKVWRPNRRMLPESNPNFHASLIGRHGMTLFSKTKGAMMAEEKKKGNVKIERGQVLLQEPAFSRINEFQEKTGEVYRKALAHERDRVFSGTELEGVRHVIRTQLRRLAAMNPVIYNFIKKKIDLDGTIREIDSVNYLFATIKEVNEFVTSNRFIHLPYPEQQKWEQAIPEMRKIFYRAVGTHLLFRHLNANRFFCTHEQVDRIIEEVVPQADLGEIMLNRESFGKLERKVGKAIVNHRRTTRRESAIKIRKVAKKMRHVKRILQGFDMDRASLKNIYRDARTRLNRDEHNTLRSIAYRSFKRSQEFLRGRLTKMGISPELVFNALDLNGGLEKITTERMRKLKELNEIFRTHPASGERRSRIMALVERETDLSRTAVTRIVSPSLFVAPKKAPPVRNPKKAAKQADRKARASNGVEPVNTPAPSRPELKSMHSILDHFRTQRQILPEDMVALRRFMRGIRPKDFSKDNLIALIRYSILCEMATHHKRSGRVQERALRAESCPQTLHYLFKDALRSLFKDRILEYISHYGRSDFVSLTASSASQILGKYDTKHAQQSRPD